MSTLRARIQAAKADKPLLLKPLVTAWIIKNSNNRSWSPEAMVLAARLMSRQEAKSKEHRFSPSSANYDGCDRHAVIGYMGYPSDEITDPLTLNRFMAGDMTHLKWQVMLFEMGFAPDEHLEMPVALPEYGAQGTCDGVLSVPMVDWNPGMTREETRNLVEVLEAEQPDKVWHPLLEIKDMNDHRWRRCYTGGRTEEKIEWQGAVYHQGASRKLGFDLDGVCFWHENKATNDFTEFDWDPTPAVLEQMRVQYRDWLRLTSSESLPERSFADGSRECNYCGVFSHCKRLEAKGKTTIKPFATGRVK